MTRVLALLAACALLALPAVTIATLQVSVDGRHLVDDDAQPFLLTGDSAWSLIAQPTLAEAQLYLQDRANRGFNFVIVNLLEHRFTTNAPKNANGAAPFTGTPFVTPNEAYFAHADAVLSFAESLGIVVLLAPAYQGYNCSSQGWCAEILAATLAEMREWGRFVGNRYQGLDNIIWSIGGDADPGPIKDKYREFVLGLQEFDTTHLITAHSHRGTQAVTYWPGEPWLQINNVFSPRDALYQHTQAAYDDAPDLPFFLLESYYENEHGNTHQELRAQSYWTVLTGGFGVVFGNCPIWHFGYSSSWCDLIDWQNELDHPGSIQMTHYRALFESRRWHLLVPDSGSDVLIGGAGTYGSEDYGVAAAASDGSSIIAYVPTPREVTFDTSVLSGTTVRAWWFDPVDAGATLIGDFATGTVIIPAAPSGDRVIVIDDASLGFEAPGTPLATDAPPAPDHGVRLEQNRPNPFNPATEIRFVLELDTRVEITIFDAAGRAVRELLDRFERAGPHAVSWDGRADNGYEMSSGVYFYRLKTTQGTWSRKMVLLE